jgi:hypothetical protein
MNIRPVDHLHSGAFGCRRCYARGSAAALWLAIALTAPALHAEESGEPVLVRQGLQIRELTAYGSYYSKGLFNGGYQPAGAALRADVAAGGSGQLAWTEIGQRSTLLVTYTPSYSGRVRYSSLNALNHAFSLNASRKLAPRWSFAFSVRADVSTLDQFLFAPTQSSAVASLPLQFEDLATGVLAGRSPNVQFQSLLTSAPVVDSPARNLLYGNRMFTGAVQSSVAYSWSPRLSVTFGVSGGRTQHLSDDGAGAAGSGYLLLDTNSAAGSVALSYSVSPRMQIGGSAAVSRVVSSFADAYNGAAVAWIGRTLSPRWFLKLQGGLGITDAVVYNRATTHPQPVVSGEIGYKAFSHTLLAAGDRTVSDSYGIGAMTTNSAGLTWRWKRPGSLWSLEASFSGQKLQGGTYQGTSGWRTVVGGGRALGSHSVLLAQYAHLSYSATAGSVSDLAQSAVRISLLWNPQPNAYR